MIARRGDRLVDRPIFDVVAVAAVVISVLTVIISGCGSSDTTSSPSGVTPTASVPVDFTALPRYAGSTAAGAVDVKGTATTQTYQLTEGSPEQVLAYYQTALVGWASSEAPHALNQGPQSAWRGQWQRSGATLIVSAENAPGLGPDAVQYSLSLDTA